MKSLTDYFIILYSLVQVYGSKNQD